MTPKGPRPGSGGLVRLLAGLSWLSFEQLYRMGLGLAVNVYVARSLGPEGFGALSYAVGFAYLLSAFGRLGVEEVTARDVVRRPGEAAVVLATGAVLKATGGVLGLLLMTAAATLLGEPAGVRAAVALVGLSFVPLALDVLLGWYFARHGARFVALARVSGFTLACLLRAVFAALGLSVAWFAGTYVVYTAAVAALLAALAVPAGMDFRAWRPSLGEARRLLRESWPLTLSIVTVELYQRLDQVMLRALTDFHEVGLYSAALRLTEAWYFLPTAVCAVAFPAVVRARSRSDEEAAARLRRLSAALIWACVGIALLMTLAGPPLVRRLYGAEFAAAAPIVAVLGWCVPLVGLGTLRRNWAITEGRSSYILTTSLCGLGLNAVLNLVLIERFGAIGAAWATLVARLCAEGLANLLVPGLRPFLNQTLRAVLFLPAPARRLR